MISVKKVNNKPLNLLEKIYLWEIARGIAVTTRHFFVNLFNPKGILTVSYPEVKRPLPGNANLRTRHRLKVRADGSPKCVACFLCQTACPACCIHIEAAEYVGLTTVSQRLFESGRLGAKLLLKEIEQRSVVPSSANLPPDLVIRATSAPNKGGPA